jgi:hypothetical protein
VAFHHPVFSNPGKFAGSVFALFVPEYLLGRIIGPVSANLPVDIFLMQTDGRMIYDLDTRQIGLNVFSDPLFKPFPQLVALAGRVAAEREGTGDYSFLLPGVEAPVAKVAFWRTLALYDSQWRLVITCAREALEK